MLKLFWEALSRKEGPQKGGTVCTAKSTDRTWLSVSAFNESIIKWNIDIQPPSNTNFRGWCRVWGEPGENRGEPGENWGAQKNRGRTGGIWEENRGRTGGFWYSFTKSTGGEAGALGQEPGENRGREFSLKQETQLGTKINEQDRPWKLVPSNYCK